MENEIQPNQQTTQPGPTTDPIAPPKPSPQPSGGDNTSGQGSGAIVPEEVKGWSWGGFFLTWLWGVFNGVWLSLLALIVPWPVMNVVLGVKGRELAWQSKHWDSVEQFRSTQKKWDIWGVIISLLIIPAIIVILVLTVVVAINPAERLREAEERQLQQQNQLEQQDDLPGVIIPE